MNMIGLIENGMEYTVESVVFTLCSPIMPDFPLYIISMCYSHLVDKYSVPTWYLFLFNV
jgi:hypothetical protein